MQIDIRPLDAAEIEARLDDLAALLHACVHAGASIGFILPCPLDEARAFWSAKVLPSVAGGRQDLFVAMEGDRLCGTVLLDTDTPANQPHRAEIRKLLVHPDMRRRGIARMLMAAAERRAAEHRRSLLTLDTRTGDSAEPLYASLGYETAGIIPGYCLDPHGPMFDATTIMYKQLPPEA